MEKVNLNVKNTAAFGFSFLLIFLVCILVRLPHFLSKDFFFDGDEAMIGIMAQDFLSGKGLSLYFYGQNYGFSSLEVLSTSLFIKLIGNGIWALRLGGLLLFSIGITFIWKSLRETKVSLMISIICVLFFAMSPTWFLWGSLVRGGYVTAFMCFGILFYITLLKKTDWSWVMIAAVFSMIAYESQPLFFIPILPFLVQWMLPFKLNFRKIFGFVTAFFLLALLIHYLGANETIWSPPKSAFFDMQQIQNLTTQIGGMIYSYSNFFYYTMDIPIPLWWFVLLSISLGLIATYICLFFWKSEKRVKYFILGMVLSLLLSMFLISTVSMYSPRYWLGFFTGILFLFSYAIIKGTFVKARLTILISVVLIYGIGLITVNELKRDWYYANVNELEAFDEVYQYAKKKDVKAIYTIDDLIQWKWNYLYGVDIPCTAFHEKERVSFFKNSVRDYYLNRKDENVVIGYYNIYDGFKVNDQFLTNIEQVNSKYFIIRNVSDEKIDSAYRHFK